MKITYFAHINNKHRENDEDILYALKKLGHKVYAVDDRGFDVKDLVEKANNSDLFLFHKGGVSEDTPELHRLTLERLKTILASIKCKKAFWYVDKVYGGREEWIEAIAPLVDYGFMVDETFIRRHNFDNLIPLKQAAPDKRFKGKFNPIYDCDIAFIGSTYGEARQIFLSEMNKRYGDKFRVYTDVWEKDFADLCKSAKMIVSPNYPIDDFYWGNRIYMVMGYGGLIAHPKCYGLNEQGFKSGVHYLGYSDWAELVEILDYFIVHPKELKKIAKAGRDFVLANYTYTKVCQNLLEKIK